MSTDPGQQVPEDLPHHERGRHAGRHHEGDPFQDSEMDQDEGLHSAFDKIHEPGHGEGGDHAGEDDAGKDDADPADRDDGGG